MENVAAPDKGDEAIGQAASLLIADKSVSVGDTIEFTTERNGHQDVFRVVVGGIEQRKLFKVIGGEDLYYTIIPALEVWVNETKLEAQGAVYQEERRAMILVDKMDLRERICRTKGAQFERKVVNLTVASLQPAAC